MKFLPELAMYSSCLSTWDFPKFIVSYGVSQPDLCKNIHVNIITVPSKNNVCTTYQKIAEPIQQQATSSHTHHRDGMMHLIVVFNVDQRLQSFHH